MTEYTLIIDGKKVKTGKTFDVLNPATEEVLAQCSMASQEHVDEAVTAARVAFKAWSRKSWSERQKALMDLADLIEQNFNELAMLLTQEQGKPLHSQVGAPFEVGGTIGWIRATAAMEIPVEVIQEYDETRIGLDGKPQGRIEVHRKALGVVGSIAPWNAPLMIAIWHIIPAILTGNTVVLKPSSLTPLSTLKMVELAQQVLPPGVLSVLTGEGGLGRMITGHEGINKISFTGSTLTGKHIMRNAADTLKKMTLELGGNDAAIVLSDVDPKVVAPQLFFLAFLNSGQVCAAIKRLYVHENIYEEVCQIIAGIASQAQESMGNGLEEGVEFGPVQNREQFDFVCELAESAKADGGRFLCGGEPLPGRGYFFPLTVVADLDNGTRLVDEEPFGPILPIMKFSDVDDAISRANDNPNGLSGSVWSNNLEKAQEIGSQLECGTVWINSHAMVTPQAPMCGVKQSGIGVSFGIEGLMEYTHPQTFHINKA